MRILSYSVLFIGLGQIFLCIDLLLTKRNVRALKARVEMIETAAN